jgi:sec-independent protein translocase protein TatA
MGLPSVGPVELIIVLIIALLVIGPRRLPEMGNAVGKTIREFRKASTEMSEATTIVPEEKPSSGQGTSGSSAPAPAAATPAGSTSVAETGESSPAADAPSDDR